VIQELKIVAPIFLAAATIVAVGMMWCLLRFSHLPF
jgi:hypothetical protein